MNSCVVSQPIGPVYTGAPDWFLKAVAMPATSYFVESRGTSLHYRCWNENDTSKPDLLFVHGYKGNSRWWDFIAPFFTDRFRVTAMDLSGMGESGNRPFYSAASFSEDVIEILGTRRSPATLIGHSYGGSRVLRVCAERPDLVSRAIVLDTRILYPDVDRSSVVQQMGRGRAYATYTEARSRYRLVPEQPMALPYLVEHIAFHSLVKGTAGWQWRFDPALPTAGTEVNEADAETMLSRVHTSVDFVYGEMSPLVEPWRVARIVASLRNCTGAIAIPECHHHMMLDQPLAIIALLRALLVKAI